MKHLNYFIQERLKISKDTKVKRLFSEEYVLFVPYDNNFYYMKNNYKELLINLGNFFVFLVKKSDAIDIYNKLPSKTITDSKSKNSYNGITIYKIPSNIDSKKKLIEINKTKYSESPINPDNSNHWEFIENIDELK